MIAFKDVSAKAQNLISLREFFTDEKVIEDLGNSEKEKEEALRDRGFLVVIAPILGARKTSQGKAPVVLWMVDIFISIQINPKVNPEKANKNIYEAITELTQALISDSPLNPNDRFECDEESLLLSGFDPGLLAYDLVFNKLCVL